MKTPQERLDEVRARCTDRENHLIDELRFGKIGRREFVRRAAIAGMAIPFAGLIATACGAPTGSTRGGGRAAVRRAEVRRHDPPRPGGAGGRARPGDGQQPGWAHGARPDRRVPRLVGRQPRAAATARRELVVERRRLRVDVQAAPGRDVPRRRDDGRRGRGDDVRPPRRSRQRLQRAVGVRRRALEGWHRGPSTTPRSSSRSTRRTATFPTSPARTTTTRSSCPRTTTVTGTARSSAPDRGSSTTYRPGEGITLAAQRAVLGSGSQAARREGRGRVLRQRAEPDPRVPGQPGRRRRRSSRCPAARHCSPIRRSSPPS